MDEISAQKGRWVDLFGGGAKAVKEQEKILAPLEKERDRLEGLLTVYHQLSESRDEAAGKKFDIQMGDPKALVGIQRQFDVLAGAAEELDNTLANIPEGTKAYRQMEQEIDR